MVVTNPSPGGGSFQHAELHGEQSRHLRSQASPELPPRRGQPLQTLTINGTNFVSTSMVTYNGVAHTATFVSSTQLKIMLSAADQATVGTYAVVVTNPAPGGGASNSVNFTVDSVNNPVPTISSLSPSSVIAGAAAQTLTINGTGFIASSVVTYNGVAHAATFVSSTQLTIMLSASDQGHGRNIPGGGDQPGAGWGSFERL